MTCPAAESNHCCDHPGDNSVGHATDLVRLPTEKELFLFGKVAGTKGPAGEVARQDFSGPYGYVME